MSKLGRPKSGKVKEKIITLRVEPETYEKLVQYAESRGKTASGVIREQIEKVLRRGANDAKRTKSERDLSDS